MSATSPTSPSSAVVDPFSRSSTLTDLNTISQGFDPMPSPQAWLVSSKRRAMPSLLDPPGSPLELLLPITRRMEHNQWNKRLSLLTHRYMREYGIAREDEIIEKAWRTLELFCVGEEARKSLQTFKSTFFTLPTPSRELQTRSLALDRSSSWLSFPTFLDDSFNLSHTSLSLLSQSSSMDPLNDGQTKAKIQQPLDHRASLRGSFQSPLESRDSHARFENMAGRVNPRYMTPTAASRGQVSTPEPRAATPLTASSTGKRKAWVISAAKRVGFVSDTPRSKKEGGVYERLSPRKMVDDTGGPKSPYQHPNNPLSASSTAATPPVVGAASTKAETKHETLQSSPMVPIKDVRQRGRLELSSPPDKPLPSLPVATIQTGPPIIRRSLIDAREKPLRRSISPSPGEKAEEEWPVLFPSRTTSLQEISPDGSLKQARSPEGDKSRPNPELTSCNQQYIDDSEDGIDATSADRNLQQDYLSAQLPSGNANDAVRVSMDSETTMNLVKPRNESPAMPSNGKGLSPTAADKDTFNSDTLTDRGFLNERSPEQSLSANDDKSSSPTSPLDGMIRPIKNASSSRGGVRARASRLPKRLSAPGPVRSSSSPRRTSSRGPLPYGPLPPPTYRGRPVKHDCHSSSMRRQIGRGTPPPISQATHSADFAFEDVPSLVAVKQSSKMGVADSGGRSIPRPRNHSKPDEDVDSESEITVSKLPKRKLNRNRLTSEQKSEDGDIDTDEGRERKEDKPSKASDTAAESNQIAEIPEHERSITGAIGRAVSSLTKSEGLTSVTQGLSSERQKCSSGVLDNDLNPSQSVADSASTTEPYFNTARQRQLIDKPFNRVKRLSATSPDHGPVLRISDSAERVIMGHRSGEIYDGHNTKAQKRNSVPDLRRSIIVKELRKSTEGLLNGLSPLSRSLTTRSLNRPESREETSESRSRDETTPLCSELCSPRVCLSAPRFNDPFSARDNKILAEADDLDRKSGAEDPVDWPLRGPVQAAGDLHPVEEAKAEEERPWISPLHMSHNEVVSERKSPSPVRNGEGGLSKAADNSGRVSKRVIARSPPPEDANAPRVSREPVPVTINELRSAIYRKAQFPPRTSSRANTPDISIRSRPQINQNTSRNIPNRFVSLRANRLSQEFGVPKSTALDEPEILRSSIHKRKDNGNSNFSTPITRETGKGQLSSAKGMLSNFKGLFHKRSIESTPASSRSKSKDAAPRDRPTSVAMTGSPHPNYHSRSLPANSSANRSARGGAHMIRRPKDAFPQSPGLQSDEFRNATDLAIRVLDASQSEVDGAKKRRLLQFGELMVEAVTGARDAEKAMEQAKQAAARAEMHCMRGKKSVLELTRLVGQELNEN